VREREREHEDPKHGQTTRIGNPATPKEEETLKCTDEEQKPNKTQSTHYQPFCIVGILPAL